MTKRRRPELIGGPGTVSIVTGGAAGIGRSLSTAFARRGDIVVIADRDGAVARTTAAELNAELGQESGQESGQEFGGKTGSSGKATVEAYTVDVSDRAAVAAMVADVVHRHGRLDVLVNNAGVADVAWCHDLTAEQWDRSIDVNLRGVVHGVEAAYPVMLQQRRGGIVNIASLAGLVPAPSVVPYGATKHAVVGLSLALRAEAAARGVRVIAVCPGFINTDMITKGEQSRGLGLYAPDALAADVLRGLEKNRPLVVTPRYARVLWRIERLSPRAGSAIAGVIADRFSREPPRWRRRLVARVMGQPTPDTTQPASGGAAAPDRAPAAN